MTLFGHMTVGARDLERSARFYDATSFPSARRGGSWLPMGMRLALARRQMGARGAAALKA